MIYDNLFFEEERPAFDSRHRQEDLKEIGEYFRPHREDLGRVKVISPDTSAGERHYNVSCDKGRRYQVCFRRDHIHIDRI